MMKKGLTDLCYGFFSTLANPTRLGIIETIKEHPKNVTQIAHELDQEQSMISHNLRPLVLCSFIQVKREGKHRIYSINKETIEPLLIIIEKHYHKFCNDGQTCPHKQNLKKP